ncbi:solute carrier family 22 member 17-like, partial [Heterodontus francisci]|uniref:solute carrier family 22 member 17-like n=1 Tax=Heterodontus francisci TaxID=7792 RepID=UPI00355C4267
AGDGSRDFPSSPQPGLDPGNGCRGYDGLSAHSGGGFGRYQKLLCALTCLPVPLTTFALLSDVFYTLEQALSGLAPSKGVKEWVEEGEEEEGDSSCHLYLNGTHQGTVHCPDGWEYSKGEGLQTNIVTQWDLVCDSSWTIYVEEVCLILGCLTGYLLMGYSADRLGRRNSFILSLTLSILFGTLVTVSPNPATFILARFVQGCSIAGIILTLYLIRLELCDPPHRLLVSMTAGFLAVGGHFLLLGLAVGCGDWRFLQGVITAPLALFLIYCCPRVFPESPRWLLASNQISEAKTVLLLILEKNGHFLQQEPVELDESFADCTQYSSCGPTSVLDSSSKQTQYYSLSISKERKLSLSLSTSPSGFPSLSLSPHSCPRVFPESPRWLLASNQISEAKTVLLLILEKNGHFLQQEPVELDESFAELDPGYPGNQGPSPHSICKLLNSRNIWKNILILGFTTFIGHGIQHCYGTFRHKVPGTGSGFYFMYLLSAGTGMLACLALCITVDRFGRRGILLFSMTLTGLASLTLLGLTKYLNHAAIITFSILGLFASQAVAILSVFFSAEIIPTVIRGEGLGLILSLASIGQLSSPILDLQQQHGYFLQHVVFASFAILSTLCIMLLPESKRKPLPESVRDGDRYRRPSLLRRRRDNVPLLAAPNPTI